MRELTKEQFSALKAAFEAHLKDDMAIPPYYITFEAGFIASLDHAAGEVERLRAENETMAYNEAEGDRMRLVVAEQVEELQAERDEARATVERLRAAVATWKKSAKRHRHNERRKQKALEVWKQEVWQQTDAVAELNANLRAEIDRLRAALEPLAALWRDAYEDKPDDTPVYGLNDVVLRVGDIRAARQALEGER